MLPSGYEIRSPLHFTDNNSMMQNQLQQQYIAANSNNMGIAASPATVADNIIVNAAMVNNLVQENHWLRDQMKQLGELNNKLMCEIERIKLEMDMNELKRAICQPEDR